jgi:DNA-binding NtrC family response regulator
MPENATHLLLVEDEAPLREAVAARLAEHGLMVDQASSGESALERLAEFAYDVLITDLRLPGLGGRTVLETALERYPDIIVIIVTGYGTVRDAVDAIKRGAADFVTKPFQFDELLHAIEAALEKRRLKSENAYLRSQLEERYRFEGLIGRSRAMRDLCQLLETVASTSSTIMITGETGTGKEVVARAIHHNSLRRAQRFVALNCSAIPESLLEAELFGHARGAFTGAVAERPGVFEEAHTGTLLLDEIGELSLRAQAKVLRTIQEGELRRVGENIARRVDVRIVSATNRDLRQEVAAGRFRLDLLYRLDVIRISLPPLRARRDDIAALVDHCWREATGRVGSRAVLSSATIAALARYDWPGNVRELQNVLAALVVRSPKRGVVPPTALPPPFATPPAGMSFRLDEARRTFEERFVRAALVRSGGHRIRAAEELGVTRQGLTKLMTRLRISDAIDSPTPDR